MNRRRILITGTSGRLGSALVRAFAGRHDIVQMDVKGPAESAAPGTGRLVVGSITEPAVVEQAIEGVDTVIHCAAIPGNSKPYYRLVETNVMGTFGLLHAAAERPEVEQFIYISSLRWHGILSEPPQDSMPRTLPITERHPTLNSDTYCCSKVQAEYWCRVYAQNARKPAIAIRPSFIVSESGQPAFAAREPGPLPALCDYIGTTDLVRSIELAMDYHPVDGFDAFLINAADQFTTAPTLELVERYFPGIPADRHALSLHGAFTALIDCSHARERLGWTPEFKCKR